MNPRHLLAILDLQFRLATNQIRKQTPVTRIFTLLALALAVLVSVSSLIGVLTMSSWFLPAEPPWWLAFVWDGLTIAFVVGWIWGMVTDLQQAEALSLDRFLHLPVSPAGVLTLNYLASLVSLNLLMFAPLMFGFAVVLALRYGGWFWLSPLLVAACFWMVTAVGWQLKGFLASLMSDPKRKRQLMGAGTILLLGLVALPAILDRTVFASANGDNSRRAFERRQVELDQQVATGTLTQEQREAEVARLRSQREAARTARWAWMKDAAGEFNRWCPLGWLPQGIGSASAGNGWAVVLCLLGMSAIGAASLHSAWRTAIRTQRGVHRVTGARAPRAESVAASAAPAGATGIPVAVQTGGEQGLAAPALAAGSNWIEGSWFGVSGMQAAVARGWLRSLSRATEAKVALLWPALVLALMLGTALSGQGAGIAEAWRPLTGAGICFFLIMGVTQLVQNQFGFDRNGFRAYLLAPLNERDLLIGKNLAVTPVGLLLGLIALAGVQWFMPMKLTHLIATAFQLGNMMIVACLVSNLMSILTPLAMKPGSLKPVNLKFGIALLQLLIFCLAPVALLPVLLPLLAEWLLSATPGWNRVPLYLICAGLGLMVFVPVYRVTIGWQAELLHRRRHRVLETVTEIQG